MAEKKKKERKKEKKDSTESELNNKKKEKHKKIKLPKIRKASDKNKSDTKDKKDEKVKPGFSAILKIVLIFFVAISIIFIAARTIGGVTLTSIVSEIKIFIQSLGWGDGYPCKTYGEPAQEIFIDGSKVFVYSKDKTLLLSSSAKNLSEIPVEYGNPAIKYKNGRALIYDRDSSKMRLQKTSQIITEKEAEGVILAAALGKKGNFAYAYQGEGLKTVLKVFDKREKEVFSRSFSGERVTDIDLSNDGKYAVVSTIISKNAQVSSRVYVFKFDTKDYISCFDYENSAVVNVSYDNSHNIVVMTNTGRGYIEDNTTECEIVSFESDILFKCSHSPKKYNAVALKRYGGDNYGTVKIYKRNEQKLSANIDKEIKDIYCSEKYTAVLTSDSVLVYKNKNGELKAEIPAELSVGEVALKGKKVYMMSPSEIICQKF